ncbi:hypothetical protein CHU32_13430 [Superficieibacter electus]|uniref:Uncharacterized protein n=1 Tax=Superficieibacter electus TaxID=2022662 RepID=A0A2P5GP06_9ENTR|nr:hypothetical protein [Superficieibacter electus]POP44883.1 hypothetical protein CHU33_10505 [Superficieibacter electus]POP48270.1 hypothetical protein CHU32_13430 [Superficieibacter electus]
MERIYLENNAYDIGLSEGLFFAQPAEGDRISGTTLEELAKSLAYVNNFSCEEILQTIINSL